MTLAVFATLRSISKPMNNGKSVELKLTLAASSDLEGEIYLRVPIGHADRYTVDALYAVNLIPMPE